MPGLATLLLASVGTITATQSMEISTSAALLAVNGLWAVAPLCTAALSTMLGFAAAREMASTKPRSFILDQLRGSGLLFLVVVLATAYGFGPLITNRGVRSYLTDSATATYLLNVLGVPQFELPGVFEFNDLSAVVNANVWPVPFAIAIVALLCVPTRNRWLGYAPIILAGTLAVGVVFAQSLDVLPSIGSDFPSLALRGDGLSGLLGALLGITAYRTRTRIALRGLWAFGAMAALALVVLVGEAGWPAIPAFRVGIAVPLAYLTLYLILRPLPLSGVAQAAQPYLSGVFLMSFPLQQLAIERGPRDQTFLVNFGLAIPAAVALSVAWWFLIGRRLLSARRRQEMTEPRRTGAEATSFRERRWRLRQQVGASIPALAISAVVALIAMGMLAMLYIASLPASGGM